MREDTTRQIDLVLSTPLPLTLHPAAVYLSSLSPTSRRTMEKALNVIARLLTSNQCDAMSLDWSKLRYQHTAAIRAIFIEQYSPATTNRMLCAMRRVLKESLRLGFMSAQDYQYAIDLKSVRGDSGLPGRLIKPEEITSLLRNCLQDNVIGIRDAALIGILSSCGLRRSEAVALEMNDFNREDNLLTVRQGKGGKSRRVYLPPGVVGILNDWLKIRGKSSGALICPVKRGGHIHIQHLTDQAVMAICQKRADSTGIKPFSPHDFRRTFVTRLLESGIDVLTVSQLAGHVNLATTQKYDLRGEAAKRKAVECLNFLYENFF
ncbi:tyrosine-type recombinase/integrase (plasmid) [Anabaena sp. FACHB-709]|uniref:Integrase/recombinase n=2 Tax=Nostocaceae TaxID=1162 RepID=A0A1Z4KUV4_ANAVA|nr:MULTISPECIES: site-specific integrase [Nostocaceae]BAY72622.1 integrase/recombinase [Trichormus variabilis NIES-23]MBD2174207.1 site-specific integrase [Anabaena cylindrica FACHB-318]MBD2265995.1 site-specific integrase [Anabaena sp. FACHB-709]MBD2275472.1 site-specific integrase [Nostoc sp. PCC 7120 = FACHB-418]MBD2286297.1 site-specific integrase [Anabaena cylindrica FACHB-170]